MFLLLLLFIYSSRRRRRSGIDETDLGEGIFYLETSPYNDQITVCPLISEADDDSSRKSDRSEDSDFEIDDIYIKKQLIFGNK